MENLSLIHILFYTLPALIVGVISFYFFNSYTESEDKRRKYLLQKQMQKHTLPLRFQAYERLTLFLERIAIHKLVLRVAPVSEEKTSYAALLTATIEQEFEHNIAQQIYVSSECWNMIKAAKNTSIQIIRKVTQQEGVATADDLREKLIQNSLENTSLTDKALVYIKDEVSDLF